MKNISEERIKKIVGDIGIVGREKKRSEIEEESGGEDRKKIEIEGMGGKEDMRIILVEKEIENRNELKIEKKRF